MTTTLRIRAVARQRGVTLTELMIALVLGALVVLAGAAMVVASRGTYRSQDEGTRLAESARFGLELSNRLVRLAGYTNFGDDSAPPASYTPDPSWPATKDSYAFNGPNVVGTNDSKPGGGTNSGFNHSDSLTIRFFGSSPPNSVAADGNIVDCAGFPVPQAPTASGPLATAAAKDINNVARAYNVLFVEPETDGEPALKCQRQTYDATTGQPSGVASDPQTLIRGVEDFQVLYGEQIPLPPPNDDLDTNPPQSIVYRTGLNGPNPVGDWNNVRSVRIAMVLRSAVGARTDPDPTPVYHLFGARYPAANDPGADFEVSKLSAADRTRVRRVVETTVFIRNRMGDWQSVFVN